MAPWPSPVRGWKWGDVRRRSRGVAAVGPRPPAATPLDRRANRSRGGGSASETATLSRQSEPPPSNARHHPPRRMCPGAISTL